MAFHDCDVEEADILEVQSVSDMFSAFKTPAADAVKLIGGDDIAVFSPSAAASARDEGAEGEKHKAGM